MGQPWQSSPPTLLVHGHPGGFGPPGKTTSCPLLSLQLGAPQGAGSRLSWGCGGWEWVLRNKERCSRGSLYKARVLGSSKKEAAGAGPPQARDKGGACSGGPMAC